MRELRERISTIFRWFYRKQFGQNSTSSAQNRVVYIRIYRYVPKRRNNNARRALPRPFPTSDSSRAAVISKTKQKTNIVPSRIYTFVFRLTDREGEGQEEEFGKKYRRTYEYVIIVRRARAYVVHEYVRYRYKDYYLGARVYLIITENDLSSKRNIIRPSSTYIGIIRDGNFTYIHTRI